MGIAGIVPYETLSCGIFFAMHTHLSPLYPAEAGLADNFCACPAFCVPLFGNF
jgi:hypothetical protein